MSKHTAGPWTVEDVMGDGPIDICGPDIPGMGSPNLIATALTDMGVGGDVLHGSLEAIANARLIAASPDLLRLLRKASGAVAEIHGQGIGCPDCNKLSDGTGPCAFELEIEAAIAKAEGRRADRSKSSETACPAVKAKQRARAALRGGGE